MSHVSIYLPDDLEKKARKAAKSTGTSLSNWVASKIRKDLDQNWPREVLDAAGAFKDFPTAEELRKGYGRDAKRESLR